MKNQDMAAKRLVEVLVAEGVSHVFCVPGESYLAVLDALADVKHKIEVICCRHEAGAANMAAAYGKLTGRPGICMVTRGPGATHASIGIHTAQQDSAPMIMFVGQVARAYKGLEAFQELDYVSVFGSMTKWTAEIDQPERIAEFTSRAFSIAAHGRMGPVVLALPEDMLFEPVKAAPIPQTRRDPAAPLPALGAVEDRLRRAQKPLLILGGSGWTKNAIARLSQWCEASDMPVALAFRRKDLIDNGHPCYIGDLGFGPNPKLVARVRAADLIVAIGPRLGEVTSQSYALFDRAETARKLVHIHPDPDELNRVWPCAIGIAADVSSAAEALSLIPLDGKAWRAATQDAHAEYAAFTAPIDVTGPLNLSRVFGHLQTAMPADTIVCNGAGNYAAWLHRFYGHRAPFTQLAPTSGAMGFGLPAAIAAKLAQPQRDVIAVAGDGCFMMAAPELATAVQYGAHILALVIDNGSLGTIRMHQEREFPGRQIATNLRNPDFVALARSFGAWAKLVETTAAFAPALAEARNHKGVALLHLRTSLKDIAPGKELAV
jgi:acetolactate synthase-1/2/3 large subunit